MQKLTMQTTWTGSLFGGVVAALMLVASPAFPQAIAPIDTEVLPGVAVTGYDPVAYFTEGKPVEGKAEFALQHKGAEWRFASAANRDAFKANPDKYAPQYGGYCAYAVAKGGTAKGDPKEWKIVNGKLYLNYNKEVKTLWEQDVPGHLAKSEANWPGISTRR